MFFHFFIRFVFFVNSKNDQYDLALCHVIISVCVSKEETSKDKYWNLVQLIFRENVGLFSENFGLDQKFILEGRDGVDLGWSPVFRENNIR